MTSVAKKLIIRIAGQRHANMESLYEYGSRAGFWRLQRLFEKANVPCTVFAVGMALERNPAVCECLKRMMTLPTSSSDWEVASHGYRWIDYQNVDVDTEREHIRRTVEIHERLLGKRPAGIYQGKPNVNTRNLVLEEGGFKYDSDSYADDLPYWVRRPGDNTKADATDAAPGSKEKRYHLVVPYTLSENDMCFVRSANFPSGREFGAYLKDNLRYAVEEARQYGHSTMMSVGLHCRLSKPGRVAHLAEFIEYAKTEFGSDVWICTREQIADHWYEHHYPDDDE